MEAWDLTQSVSMWDNLATFWRFEDINALWVLIGSMLLGMSASVIGAFAFLRKRSLIGDALAHAALPGVMMAFLLFGSRDPIIIFMGALFSSFVGFFIIDWLPKNTKIKPDAALAITLSFFFALGLMLLSYIQDTEMENKSGLDKILFGQAAAMTESDIHLLAYVSVFILVTVALFFQKFRLIAFNRIYAQSLGMAINRYELLLALLIVMSVVVGLQLVGVVLMAAVLLTPIAATRYWSNQLTPMLILASTIGALSALISTQVSYLAPAMPTGPWMVVSLSLLFVISLFFGTHNGLVKRWLEMKELRKRVAEENILRTFFKLTERSPQQTCFSMADIQGMRNMEAKSLSKTLDMMIANNLLQRSSQGYQLTASGIKQATQLTRRHRLWENYLQQQAEISPDMVHQQAERIEHILTDEQEAKIREELHASVSDPHGQPIPQNQNAKQGAAS